MEQIRYTVILDITDNGCFNTGWRLKQGDGQNIVLNVKVTNNGDNYVAENPPRIVFKRPDGYSVIGQMDALDDDFYTYTIVGNEIAVAGNVLMDVKFGADEDRTSTASCKFEVIPDTIGQSSGGSDVYDNTVAELVEISKANVKLAESYTKGGTGSRSGEDTDNAKYYKEQAAEIVGPLTQKVNGVIEDLTQFIDGGYLSNVHIDMNNIALNRVLGATDGSDVGSNGRCYTIDYTDVRKTKKVLLTSTIATSVNVHYYDANKVWKKSDNRWVALPYEIEVGNDIAFLRFSFNVSNSAITQAQVDALGIKLADESTPSNTELKENFTQLSEITQKELSKGSNITSGNIYLTQIGKLCIITCINVKSSVNGSTALISESMPTPLSTRFASVLRTTNANDTATVFLPSATPNIPQINSNNSNVAYIGELVYIAQ